jgi:dihydroxy-acid dehydratase
MRRLLPDTSRRRLLVAVQHASFSTTDKAVTITLNQRSRGLTGDPDKGTLEDGSWEKMATSRANLRAIGWGEGDFRKPIVTVASPWSNANPCNYHHRELTDLMVDAIERRGGKAFVAGTPIISDGMTQGTPGMKYSLISREYIADCVELMHEGYMADAMITLGGCDKSVPAAAMPLARTDAVGLMLYGGTALPGLCEGCTNAKVGGWEVDNFICRKGSK